MEIIFIILRYVILVLGIVLAVFMNIACLAMLRMQKGD